MNAKNYKPRAISTSGALLSVVLVLMLGSCGGGSKSKTDSSDFSESTPVPEHPPVYLVRVEVCDYAPDQPCKVINSKLWGDVGEAKMLPVSPQESGEETLVEQKLAISSRGCLGAYPQPQAQQFYWESLSLGVDSNFTPKVKVETTLIDNEEVDELLNFGLPKVFVETIRASCQPVPSNLLAGP
jgi:hypothetical protein